MSKAGAASKDIAKRRLKNVLDAERNGLSQKDLDLIKNDLTQVLCSYFETSGEKTVLKIERRKAKDGSVERVLSLSARIGAVKRTGLKV